MTKPVRTEDTENGRYDLVVRATDQGNPEPLYSDVKVFVDVGSIRNQKPKFTQSEYKRRRLITTYTYLVKHLALLNNCTTYTVHSRSVEFSHPEGCRMGDGTITMLLRST